MDQIAYNQDLTHKTILVGDSGVGKTSLLVQFDQGKFIPGSFSATVGIGFTNKVLTVDELKVKLQVRETHTNTHTLTLKGSRAGCSFQIWDTAGQERFRSVTHAYYRDAQALLLLYDITSRSSFDNTRAWLTEIHEYAQDNIVIMLLGNKSDMSNKRVIRREEGEKLAREYGVIFLETSAKTGSLCVVLFISLLMVLGSSFSSPWSRRMNLQEAAVGSAELMNQTQKQVQLLYQCCGLKLIQISVKNLQKQLSQIGNADQRVL
ncbi:hypothetical protein DNTS_027542 [Danionella cerebrum]|uniref:Small monomeric GTPase n=1 Tax=Danionella cerebrum TaxID=2873325 RepID=A0A553RQM1_9TELE|nr:hypothetical protein DNTS_027542 [Danionella translucida]